LLLFRLLLIIIIAVVSFAVVFYINNMSLLLTEKHQNCFRQIKSTLCNLCPKRNWLLTTARWPRTKCPVIEKLTLGCCSCGWLDTCVRQMAVSMHAVLLQRLASRTVVKWLLQSSLLADESVLGFEYR